MSRSASVRSILRSGWWVVAFTAPAFAQPALSPRIALDHGYRYHQPNDETRDVALGVDGDQVILTFAQDFDVLRGYRRTTAGARIDLESHRLGRNQMEGFSRDHDLAVGDPEGWKLAYVSGPSGAGTGLYVCNVDPDDFTPTAEVVLAPEGVERIFHPEIGFDGTRHIVVWAEEVAGTWELRLTRVSPGLEVIGEGAMTVASGILPGSLGLATNGSSGLIAYVTQDHALMVQPIDGAGLPLGVPVEVAEASHLPGPLLLALTTFGSGYLVAWDGVSGRIEYARLDAAGALQGPIRSLPTYSDFGLAACGGGQMAMIAYISETEVRAYRIDADGEVVGNPYTFSPAYQHYDGNLTNNIDCVWAGDHFVVAWNSYLAPFRPAGGPRISPQSLEWTGEGWLPPSGVFAQWVAASGEPLFGEPVDITSGSSIRSATAGYGDGVFRSILADAYSEDFHTVGFDGLGTPVGEPGRTSGQLQQMAPLVTRPALECSDAVVHATAWASRVDYDSEFPPHNRIYVGVEFHEADGDRPDWTGAVLCTDCPGWVPTVDVAAARDSVLLIYDHAVWGQPTVVEARLHADLTQLSRIWTIDSANAQSEPTVIPLPGRYLAAWRDGEVGAERIHVGWIDPADPNSTISGQALMPQSGVQAMPWLAVGADQVLCVWQASLPGAPTGEDIYALRLGLDGAPVDPQPILVGETAGFDAVPRAVWDGEHWVVSWRNGYSGSQTAYVNLLDSDGELVYPEATALGPSGQQIPALASDGQGTTLISCGGRWVRFLYGATSDLSPDPVQAPSRFQVSAVWPNPSRGRITFRLEGTLDGVRGEILDVAGRRVRDLGPLGPLVSWDGRLDDGAVAPSGAYFFRGVTAGGETVGRRFLRVR